jgi:hypothetical protein
MRSENFHTHLKIDLWGHDDEDQTEMCAEDHEEILGARLRFAEDAQRTLCSHTGLGARADQSAVPKTGHLGTGQSDRNRLVSREPTSEHNQAVFVIKQNREVFHR